MSKKKQAKSEEKLPSTKFVLTMLTLLIIWLLVSSMTYVWIQMETIQTGYKLVQAHKKQEALLEVKRKLEVEWNYQHSPERLVKLANKYGFRPPKKNERIVLGTFD